MDDNFNCDPDHYEILKMSPSEAANKIKTAWGKAKYKRLPPSHYGPNDLPREYLNLKEKCFQGTQYTCAKPGHACTREVSATRDRYKSSRRAMAGSIEATMVAAEDPTWEINGLHTFAPQLHERVGKLRTHKRYLTKCARCSRKKRILTIAKGDGAQMYKDVPPTIAIGCLKK